MNEEILKVEIQDINYIPNYRVAEEERRANELERISNENDRKDYYEEIQEKVNNGEMDGKNTVYVGTEEPIDDFYNVWIDPEGTPEVSAENLVFSDSETLQEKYENGELKGPKGDTPDLKGYATEEYVNNKVSSVYKYKGSVATKTALPTTDLTVGDVYNTTDTGMNYAWTGSVWDELGSNVDLTGIEACFDGSKPMGSIVVEDIECKNLFNKNNTISGWISVEDIWSSGDSFRTSEYIEVQPNTEYTLNLGNATNLQSCGLNQYDSNKSLIETGVAETQVVITFTTSATTKYVRFVLRNDAKDSVQLEKGSSASEVVPYKDFDNACKQLSNFASANNGFTILSQVIFKQGNRYFGNLVVQKDSGNFEATNESVATLPVDCVAGMNSGCFLGTTQWNVLGIGYFFVNNENNTTHFVVSDFASSNCNIAKITFEVVAK